MTEAELTQSVHMAIAGSALLVVGFFYAKWHNHTERPYDP